MSQVDMARIVLWAAFSTSAVIWARFVMVVLILGRYTGRRCQLVADFVYLLTLSWGASLYAVIVFTPIDPSAEHVRNWLQWVLPVVILYPAVRLSRSLYLQLKQWQEIHEEE